jgi:hypothetical protein
MHFGFVDSLVTVPLFTTKLFLKAYFQSSALCSCSELASFVQENRMCRETQRGPDRPWRHSESEIRLV